MPAKPSNPLSIWQSAPHLYSPTAWRMHLRAQTWGWLSNAAEKDQEQIDALPAEYRAVFAEELAYKKARPWLCKP